MKKYRLLTAAAAATLMLWPTAVPAFAAEAAPAMTVPVPKVPAGVSATGTLTYVTDVESPHWEVDGWVLQVEDPAGLLFQFDGQKVAVSGTEFKGMSIMMRRTLVVHTVQGVLLDGSQVVLTADELKAGQASEPGAPAEQTGPAEEAAEPSQAQLQVEGVLELERRLETPHFVVNGWALSVEDAQALEALAGKHVVIKGTEFTGPSILMRRTLVVSEVTTEVRGKLVYVTDVETPHWEIDGLIVVGADTQLQALADQEVTVTATLMTGPSIFMKPALEIKAVTEAPAAPSVVKVKGAEVKLPIAPVVQEGYLMVPLRAVVEAAGGTVTWDPVSWSVKVSMAGREGYVHVGQNSAAGNRNPAPMLVNGHTLVDVAYLQELGLYAQWSGSMLYFYQPSAGEAAR
jgi:hypothetical protein